MKLSKRRCDLWVYYKQVIYISYIQSMVYIKLLLTSENVI